ncbi:hypothetical protein MXB_752, partial [Myxobolus squamalis]
CLIAIAHDLTANIYVRTVWTLMTYKNEYLYSAEPKLIILDFEKIIAKLCKLSIQIIKICQMLFSFQAEKWDPNAHTIPLVQQQDQFRRNTSTNK